MEKAIIIGCPGSGKSTFARKLSDIKHLPLYHLDMMYWNKDKTTVSKDIFEKRLHKAMYNPNWIIDGNYASTMEMRISNCDTVFFLDYPTEICMDGILNRKGKPRPDMPWIENGDTDQDFIDFVNKFRIVNRPEIIRLLDKYNEKNIIIFHFREEAEIFLNDIKSHLY